MYELSISKVVFCPIFFGVTTLFSMVTCMSPSDAVAQTPEFKIETSLYSGDNKQPFSQNITLFSQGLVFDFTTDGSSPPNILETKIYDSREKQVALLNHQTETQLELSDTRLLQMVDGLRRDISQKPDLKFLVEETFTETEETSLSQVRLSSPTIDYRAVGKRPDDTRRLVIYSEFLDTFARLNASHPGSFPPFARLRLNESIKKHGWIATEVEVKIQANAMLSRGVAMRSTHIVIDGLSDDDQQRIVKAKQQWLNYKKVDLLTFRGIKKPTVAESIRNKSGKDEKISR